MTDPHGLPDDVVFAGTLYGEIATGDRQQKINVASAIMNRVDADLHGDGQPDWWGESVKGVCLKRAQFSCWNADDPNRERILKAIRQESDPVYRECLTIARQVMAGAISDPTQESTHYHTVKNILNLPVWPPAFYSKLAPTINDGLHQFYRDPTAYF